MLTRLVKFSQQNLRTEREVLLYGTFEDYTFIPYSDNIGCMSLYLPQKLYDGRYFYVTKDRNLIFN